MLQPYRDQFNANFTPAKYTDLVTRLTRLTHRGAAALLTWSMAPTYHL